MKPETAVALCAIVALACSDREIEYEVAPPFAEARLVQRRLFVELAPGATLPSVLRVSPAPFRAGMTHDEARAVAGEPSATRTTDYGTYHRYIVRGRPFDVAHITGPSSGGGRLDKWQIIAADVDNGPDVILGEPLRDLVARATPKELVIHEPKQAWVTAFSADIRDGRLYAMTWYGWPGHEDYRRERPKR